jgi:SHS family lactate transporter-like MFS transporter
MIAVVWLAAFDAAIAFAPSLTWILVLRTLFGFGMGAEWAAGATLAMESWPARSKHIASGLLQAGWPVGYLLAAAISTIVVPAWGWRALFLIAAAPALLVLPIRLWVKESPEWLAQRGKPRPVAAVAKAKLGEMRGKLIWGSVVMALGFGVYYAMGSQYPTMLMTEHKLGASELGLVLIVFNVGMLVGAVACGALAEKKGVLFTVAVPALLMVPLMPLYVGMAPGLLYVGAFVGGAVGLGFCGVVPSLLTGLFDTSVRARAVGFVYHAGAFLAAFVPIAVASLAETTSLSLAESIALIGGGFEVVLAIAFLASRKAAATSVAAAAGAH